MKYLHPDMTKSDEIVLSFTSVFDAIIDAYIDSGAGRVSTVDW